MRRLLPLALLLLAAPAVAAPVPKVVLTAEQEAEFNDLWDLAGKSYPKRVHCYCRLIAQPDAAVAYLTKHLPPAELGEREAKVLLKALASEDAKVWKPAFRALAVRDVRLALSPVEVWNDIDSDDLRRRFGAILSGRFGSPDSVPAEAEYSLQPPGRQIRVWMLKLVWPKAPGGDMEYLPLTYADANGDDRHRYRQAWAQVGVAVLERIGTPAAQDHLKALAKGHELSAFTSRAKEAVERFERPRDPISEKPTDLWKWELQKFTAADTVDRFLTVPKETVSLFKEKLKPLTLSKKRGTELLARLFSDDAKEMQAAIAELRYFDLRLAMRVEDAWAEAKTPAHRGRLFSTTWLRSETSDDFARVDDEHRLFDYTYHPPASDFDGWHVIRRVRDGLNDVDAQQAKAGAGGSTRVDNLLADKTSKWGESRWPREESAIYILDAIGTDDAIAIIKDMAAGHPDAGPTKAAKDVLKRRGVR